MTGDSPENLHLGAAEHPDLQRGGILDHSMPGQVDLGKQFSDPEESRVPDLERGGALLAVDPEATRVGKELLVKDETVEPREAFGEKKPPARDVPHPPGRMIGRRRYQVHAIGEERDHPTQLMWVVGAI